MFVLFMPIIQHSLLLPNLKFSKMLTRLCLKTLSTKIRFRYASTQQPKDNEELTHFGFQQVTPNEKTENVYKVFEQVARNYDLMNDAMSIGIHRVWKDIFISRLGPTEGTKLLDMAGGTGDIAFRFLNYIKTNNAAKNCSVTVCDINANMLEVGKKRAKDLGFEDPTQIAWKEINAENLADFPDNSFNAYTIAFGIRNVTHIDKCLAEAHRVLQPGGRFLCLEFSRLQNDWAQWLYDQYSFQVIPPMGQLITGQWQPYQYLVESIKQFPSQDDFKAMIETAGFRNVTYENLNLGIVAIHSGFKL